jgi:hypothetical protein
MNKNHDGVSREARREQMAQLLARYPGLNSDELAELLHWFRKEASALDEGLISCDEKVSAAYRSFKKDHLDRLNGADLFWLAMLVGGAFLTVALIIWAA